MKIWAVKSGGGGEHYGKIALHVSVLWQNRVWGVVMCRVLGGNKVNRASRRVWAETARRLLNCKRRSREMWGLMCFGKNEAEDRLNQNITRRGGAPCNDPA